VAAYSQVTEDETQDQELLVLPLTSAHLKAIETSSLASARDFHQRSLSILKLFVATIIALVFIALSK
jgi:hypothetical protein